MTDTLKLEVGGEYIDASGDKVIIIAYDERLPRPYVGIVAAAYSQDYVESYREDGSHEGAGLHIIKPAPKPEIPLVVGGRADAAIKRAALEGDGWLGIWSSTERYAAVVQQIDEIAASHGREVNEWQHGLQIWVGTGSSKKQARRYVAEGMEEFYRVPFEKFERYSPYGSAEEIAEFLIPYVELGAHTLNLAPRGPSEDMCIETISQVSEILKKEFPGLC